MKKQPIVIRGDVRLKDFQSDYCQGLDKEKTKEKTQKLAQALGELQTLLYANGTHALLLLFQGLDASGKDGSVRRVLECVNPVGVETANFKVPSSEERAHDFLWRIHKAVPRYGHIGIFNRSHYEGVLVERVLRIVPPAVWRARYQRIVEFEQMLVENRIILVKFFLHLGKEEQAERFRERLQNPEKHWKFSPSDLETRKCWNAYQAAFEDMLNRTSHPDAPWHLVPADRNWYRDHVIATMAVQALEKLKLCWPKAREDYSKIQVR